MIKRFKKTRKKAVTFASLEDKRRHEDFVRFNLSIL